MLLREAWVIPFVKKNGPDIRFGVAPVPAPADQAGSESA